MAQVTITIDESAFSEPAAFAHWVRNTLHALVGCNRIELRRGAVPGLYSSGVRFRPEPAGSETFVCAKTCQRKGHGDCAHLAAWRCAELQNSGERASLRITWKRRSDGKMMYHVQIRREDGRIEDPSRMLGMR